MKIVVFGTGGVGGYFGGRLAHSGQDVTFVARGAHLDALRQEGLQVKSLHGDFTVFPVNATNHVESIGVADLVLVCVKAYQLPQAVAAMKPLVGEKTTILPLLNGFQAAEELITAFGQERVLGGLCSVVAFVAQAGVIHQESRFHQVVFGEWHGRPTNRAEAILAACQKAGFDVVLSQEVRRAIWRKFLFITSYSGVSSAVGLPAAGLHNSSETMDLIEQAALEIERVAHAQGVVLDDTIVEETMTFIRNLAPGATSSMQRDVQAGRLFELEAMTGAVLRAGAKSGIDTPVNRFLYAVLKPRLQLAQGNPGKGHQ